MVKTQTSATRASLCALLDDARRELLASFHGLADEQMELPLPDGWSVKDILAHVAMWDEMELPDMRRAARGSVRVLDGLDEDESLVDRWNEVQFRLRRRLPVKQVLTELSGERASIIEFLQSVPEECLTSGFIPTACAVQARHDRDHAQQIREWRQTQGI